MEGEIFVVSAFNLQSYCSGVYVASSGPGNVSVKYCILLQVCVCFCLVKPHGV